MAGRHGAGVLACVRAGSVDSCIASTLVICWLLPAWRPPASGISVGGWARRQGVGSGVDVSMLKEARLWLERVELWFLGHAQHSAGRTWRLGCQSVSGSFRCNDTLRHSKTPREAWLWISSVVCTYPCSCGTLPAKRRRSWGGEGCTRGPGTMMFLTVTLAVIVKARL